MAQQWDRSQPVFEGFKIPEWAMVDPLQDIAKNMIVQEQHQAEMRRSQLAEQKQQMDIEARMQQQQMQQGIADYIRGNPGATPDQVYGAVQQSALAGGDIATWLKIAEQMHEQNMMQERARREQERQEFADRNSALSTMVRLRGVDPDLAFKYALDNNLGVDRKSLNDKENSKKEKEVKRSSYVVYDPIAKRNIIVNQNNPEVQARLDAGLLLPKKSESEIQMMELMSQPQPEPKPGLFSRIGSWFSSDDQQKAQEPQEPQGKESLAKAKALLAGKQPGQQPAAGRMVIKKKVSE